MTISKVVLTVNFNISGNDDSKNKLDLDVKNSQHQTALGLALMMNLHDIAEQLIDCGAKMDVMNSDGLTLLHEAIMNQDTKSAIFLLNHNANVNIKYVSNIYCFFFYKRLVDFINEVINALLSTRSIRAPLICSC